MAHEIYSTDGPVCPYCGHQACPDGPSYYDESAETDECGSCGKTYSMRVSTTTSWQTEAIEEPTDG